VLTGGHKLTNRLALGLAADEARAAGVDDALLFDHADHLVETSRCNLVVVAKDGAPATPDDALGAVTGIALQVVLEQTPEIARCKIVRGELQNAREIIALNSVRGARPIIRLDGEPVGDGAPGPWAARLHDAFLRG
jgi:branched-subunit amino acid aminotransferase/4-amino-4-deoxychorismate lyase